MGFQAIIIITIITYYSYRVGIFDGQRSARNQLVINEIELIEL